MKLIVLSIAGVALIALGILGDWFKLKDAISMYPRRKKMSGPEPQDAAKLKNK